jgi:hypothetical protein
MNKLIKQLMNKFKFAQKINKPSLNILSSLIINSMSARVRNKIKQTELENSIISSIIILNACSYWRTPSALDMTMGGPGSSYAL